MSLQINATGIQPQLVVKEKKEFSYWPVSSFSFICINVFLTGMGKAGKMGVWRREGESLWWRCLFLFVFSLCCSPCLCEHPDLKKQTKNNSLFPNICFLCWFLFWMHVVLYMATSWHYRCVYVYIRRLNEVVWLHKMHIGTVARLESAQRRLTVAGLPLPDHLVGDLREHVKGELVHVTCGCATIRWFGSRSFTKQPLVVT